MLTVRKASPKNWYLEYNGVFVESFDTKKEAVAQKKIFEFKRLV